MRFEYYPDTDSLYIRAEPGRELKPGGTQEVVGWGDRDIVIDVDGDGVPVGIDIDSFASEIMDITKLEAEGPIFGLVRAKVPKEWGETMDGTLRAIEVMRRVDEQRRLHLDDPLPVNGHGRVRDII